MCLLFFYSTFSLSSQYFIQLFLSLLTYSTYVLSLFLLQIRFPHPPLPSPIPHRSSHRHCLWFEDSIAVDLKPPSPSLIWSLPIWSCIILHSSRCRWLVEFGRWLICWVGVLLKILSFFFFFGLRFLDLEFVRSGDCGCSLWRWLLLWQWLWRWLLVLGWWQLPLGCAFVYWLDIEWIYYLIYCIHYFIL